MSLPRRAAAERARQQAEVLGIGRLEKPKPAPKIEVAKPTSVVEPVENADPEPTPAPAPEPADVQAPVPLPPAPAPSEHLPSPAVQHAEPNLQGAPSTPSASTPSTADSTDEADLAEVVEPIPLPEEVVEENTVQMSDAEREVRSFFTELIESGVEPSAFMDDPRWEDINERALASDVEVWPILMEMAAMD